MGFKENEASLYYVCANDKYVNSRKVKLGFKQKIGILKRWDIKFLLNHAHREI